MQKIFARIPDHPQVGATPAHPKGGFSVLARDAPVQVAYQALFDDAWLRHAVAHQQRQQPHTQRGLVSVTRWNNILDRGQTFDMSHLDSFDAQEQLDGRAITVRYSFWPHTFSDEKANGSALNDGRFFCRKRWQVSHEAVHFISTGKFSAGYVRVYLSKKREQQFYSLDLGHMVIFCVIHKHEHAQDTINCKVISCYTVDGTTIHKLPRGKLYKVAVVYRRRLAEETIAL